MSLSAFKLSPKLLLASAILPLQATMLFAQAPNPVIEWNRTLLSIVRTPGMQPATMHSTRSFAIMHLAIEEAVNAIAARPDETEALQRTAAIAAAHRTLSRLYPNAEPGLTQAYQSSLGAASKTTGFVEAIAIGRRNADRILRERANDGSNAAADPYLFGAAPGDYQSTPPNFPKQPQLINWGAVLPFSLRGASQFRPGPPPSLSSALYSKALIEVQSLGSAMASTATPDQMLVGRFWNGAIQNYWNEIAQSASVARKLSTIETAHVFALLNVALADSAIAFYEAKYKYNFWRPVTAIRAADPALTPGASPDPFWLPEVGNTAPDPSYPGAHAVVSAAAAEVLISAFGTDWMELDVTSEVVGGVTRHFDSLSEAAVEASRSRVYAGVHFSFDLVAGERLGRRSGRLCPRTCKRPISISVPAFRHHHAPARNLPVSTIHPDR